MSIRPAITARRSRRAESLGAVIRDLDRLVTLAEEVERVRNEGDEEETR